MANFSLVDLLKRKLLGETMMQPSGFEPAQATQGLLGQGGQMGGGLLQSNLSQMNQGEGGLLSNIPQAALLGSALYGQGIQGRDPFSALLPAVTQTAQLQKYLTPEKEKLMTAYDPETKKTVFATRTQIEEKGLTPVPESPETTAAQKNFAALKQIEETGTELEKRVARMVYGNQGREPMSKTEFLSKVTTNLSKDALAEPEDIQKILPKWEKVYDDIFKIQTPSMNENILEVPETKDKLIDGQQYSIDGQILIWNKKKDQFE